MPHHLRIILLLGLGLATGAPPSPAAPEASSRMRAIEGRREIRLRPTNARAVLDTLAALRRLLEGLRADFGR